MRKTGRQEARMRDGGRAQTDREIKRFTGRK